MPKAPSGRLHAIAEAHAKLSLVEQAKRLPGTPKRPYAFDDEHVQLAAAYLLGEISDVQVAKVMNMRPSNARFWTVSILRKAVAAGKLKIEVTL
jgi:hypothetical protein